MKSCICSDICGSRPLRFCSTNTDAGSKRPRWHGHTFLNYTNPGFGRAGANRRNRSNHNASVHTACSRIRKNSLTQLDKHQCMDFEHPIHRILRPSKQICHNCTQLEKLPMAKHYAIHHASCMKNRFRNGYCIHDLLQFTRNFQNNHKGKLFIPGSESQWMHNPASIGNAAPWFSCFKFQTTRHCPRCIAPKSTQEKSKKLPICPASRNKENMLRTCLLHKNEP